MLKSSCEIYRCGREAVALPLLPSAVFYPLQPVLHLNPSVRLWQIFSTLATVLVVDPGADITKCTERNSPCAWQSLGGFFFFIIRQQMTTSETNKQKMWPGKRPCSQAACRALCFSCPARFSSFFGTSGKNGTKMSAGLTFACGPRSYN